VEEYNALVEQIILEAYEYVAKCVTMEAKLKVHALNRDQTTILIELFCKCTVSFSKEICSTIFKLIRGLYHIDNEVITLQEAVRLYRALARGVKDAADCLKLSSSDNDSAKAVDNRMVSRVINKQLKIQKQPLDMRTKKAKLEGLDYLKDTRRKRVVH
jgi:hypothetical protein